MWAMLDERLHSAMMADGKVRARLPELERDVAHMCITPVNAVREIVALMGLADRDQ
jgi:hypothetical protein